MGTLTLGRAKKKLTTEEYLDSVGDESDALAQ